MYINTVHQITFTSVIPSIFCTDDIFTCTTGSKDHSMSCCDRHIYGILTEPVNLVTLMAVLEKSCIIELYKIKVVGLISEND